VTAICPGMSAETEAHRRTEVPLPPLVTHLQARSDSQRRDVAVPPTPLRRPPRPRPARGRRSAAAEGRARRWRTRTGLWAGYRRGRTGSMALTMRVSMSVSCWIWVRVIGSNTSRGTSDCGGGPRCISAPAHSPQRDPMRDERACRLVRRGGFRTRFLQRRSHLSRSASTSNARASASRSSGTTTLCWMTRMDPSRTLILRSTTW
jgi:hypothetical protein